MNGSLGVVPIVRGVLCCAVWLVLCHAVVWGAEQPVDFNREVRPILSANCFSCHGPDEDARQAELRLDVRADAVRDRNGRRVIWPGDAEQSELLRRVTSDDPDVRMPPLEFRKTLNEEQTDVLRRWITQGAEYQPHWSFVRPRRSALPDVRHSAWPRNSIDRFVLARLESAGLQPSPQADPHTLARRLYLDLVGLPPLPAQVDAFQRDVEQSSLDRAYEELVDRLLASRQYGERWARRWLDLARYSDTNGYEKDQPRNMWIYRDWVVDALNADMPFDRFTIEQIAGDMLPNSTVNQQIATGFHRNTMLNEEGGIDPLEFRFYAMTDRVATTGTTWLGLTIGCAQCHTHKYDPITQQEYYQFMAFLNNADEPQIEVPDAKVTEQHRDDLARAEKLLAGLADHWPVAGVEGDAGGVAQDDSASVQTCRKQEIEQRFTQWLDEMRDKTANWTPLPPTKATSNLPLLTIEDDDCVFASGDITKRDTYRLTFRPQMTGITAVRLEALPDPRLPGRGPGMTYYEGRNGDFFMGEFQLQADGQPVAIAESTHSFAENQYDHAVSAVLTIDGDPQTGWSVHGRQGERHVAVYRLAQPLNDLGQLQLTMQFGRHFASSLGRFRLSATTDTGPIEALDITPEVQRLLRKRPNQLSGNERRQLMEAFLLQAPELQEHANNIRKLRRRPKYTTSLVMRERPPHHPRPTFIHHRGEFLQPVEKVNAGTPETLHPFPEDLPRNRLGFARWLVSPDNPLTPRVVVNRHWAALIGKGIVRTAEDFGTQGALPTHPDLLDWLAVDFVEHGWSIKRLHKSIVMSATYRQASGAAGEDRNALERDPDNRLLARASRHRLEAEIIRDTVLRTSGLLTTKMGGPGVYPPQPPGVTEVAYGNPKWTVSTGADRHRRSIYTFRKRTAPFAMYDVFDAPSGESCQARRDISNTPLQALTLLNDVMMLEAAQAMGRMLADYDADDTGRIRYAFRRTLTRPPQSDELAQMQQFVARQRHRLEKGELDARSLAGIEEDDGTQAVDKQVAVEQATWTTLARALMSLDEMITRN